MRLAKAQGLVERFPCGGNSRVRVRSPDPRAARLERNAVAAITTMLSGMPLVPDKPLEEMSVDELRAAVTRQALRLYLDELQCPIDGVGTLEAKREIALETLQLLAPLQLPRPRKRGPK